MQAGRGEWGKAREGEKGMRGRGDLHDNVQQRESRVEPVAFSWTRIQTIESASV